MPRKNDIQSIIDRELKSAANIDRELLRALDERLARVKDMENNTLIGGTKIRTHAYNECVGYWCCIHNPSPHHMRKWEQYWDELDAIMYRICVHGMLHPDPDDPHEFRASKKHREGCDGCCNSRDHVSRRKAG